MTGAFPLVADALEERDVEAVLECLRSGWLTMGPRTQRLEAALADWLGVEHALVVSTGTAALRLALRLTGAGSGDAVIVAASARGAAFAAAAETGAEVRPLDIRAPETPVPDAHELTAVLRDGVKAAVVAHPWGYPVGVEQLRARCDAAGVLLVEDATEALGATISGADAGTVGHLGCYSLAWGRQLGVGQGGVLVTGNAELATRARLLRSHALTSTTWDRHRGHADSYDVVDVGFNFRIDEPRAALALSRLPDLRESVARRREADHRYREWIAGWPELKPVGSEPGEASPLVFPVLAADAPLRDQLVSALQAGGVETAVRRVTHPVPRMSQFSARALALPLRPWRGGVEQDEICAVLSEARLGLLRRSALARSGEADHQARSR